MRSIMVCLVALLGIMQAAGQQRVQGRVVSDSAGVQKGIPAVEIFIPISKEVTRTDSQGYFYFTPVGSGHMELVARFNASDSDVFMYHPPYITFPVLVKSYLELKTVNVEAQKASSSINARGIQKIEILNEGEFKKAACCTLGESFETTNSVEVSNSDGVSGIRQVEMLGLAGKYVFMTRENAPLLRGFSVLNGLNQVPGPMVGTVSISKGMGSVTSSYEGITGGLNYSLKSDKKDPRIFFNSFANSQQRLENNLIWKANTSKNTYNHAFLHYGQQQYVTDYGKDGMADLPKYKRIFAADQWHFSGAKVQGLVGGLYVKENRNGGSYDALKSNNSTGKFLFNLNEEKWEGWGKLGIFLNKEKTRSIGNIITATQNHSSALLNSLNNRSWQGTHQSFSYTGLYGSNNEKKWSVTSGIQFVYDNVAEKLLDTGNLILNPSRKEWSAGVSGEVVYKTEKFLATFGSRADHNNLYGNYLTPRMYMKFDLPKGKKLHLQAGMGRRTPWVLIENLPLMISNRKIVIEQQNPKWAYGLNQEKALNFGSSFTQGIPAFSFPSTLTFDAFYTYFLNQVVADRDSDPKTLILKNESGNSTWIAQAEWMLKPHRRLDIKLSYRFVYSQMLLGGMNRLQPMQSPHRALMVLNYQNRRKVFFDLITQVNSPKRLPLTSSNPEGLKMPSYSPWYTIVNFQVRKEWKNTELYVGSENLLNFYQKNPVLSAYDPSSPYFDAAFAYGPTMGRNIYAGIRWKLK